MASLVGVAEIARPGLERGGLIVSGANAEARQLLRTVQ
jgi:hypothetical protein